MLKLRDNIYHNIIWAFFLCFLILEPLVKVLGRFDFSIRAKAIAKLMFLLTLMGFTLFIKFKKEVFFYILILVGSFFIGQLMLNSNYSLFSNSLIDEAINGDIYILTKYIYILIFIGVYEKIKDNQKLTDKLIGFFIKFMVVNTIFIGIGLITEYNMLRTYPYPNSIGFRFGYQGLIHLAGESIHLYIIAISLAYFNYLKTRRVFFLVLFILGGILLGKKAIFLYLTLLLLIHVFYIKKQKFIYVFGGLLTLVLAFNKFIFEKLLLIFPFWKDIYKDEGVITLIFSKRDILFDNCLNYIIENWTVANYMFGGINFATFRTELGFVDVFLTFGIIGLLGYCKFIYKFFIYNQSILIKSIIVAILVVESVSGGLLINILPMILFYLMTKYFEGKTTIGNKNSDILVE